jgi:Zn-dependent protease
VEDNLVFRIATWLIPLVFAIVLHEISHGWVANAFGDPTAKKLGRLSPNPIKHVDPVGTVALPMVLAIAGAPIFGWAKPVPVVAKRLRNPRLHMMLVALAGPGMNFLLAFIASIALALTPLFISDPRGLGSSFLIANLQNFLVINIFLAVFNLLPIPPFDGGHVVEGLLPRRFLPAWRKLAKVSLVIVILLIVVLPMLLPQANIIERLVVPPVRAILGLFGGLF